VGVNNRGVSATTDEDPNRFGRSMLSYWLDDHFAAFWASVVAAVRAGQ
jgi:hypothetical protein